MLNEHERKAVISGLKKILLPKGERDPLLDCLVNDLQVPVQLIADRLQVKQPTVSQWLHRKRPIPERHIEPLRALLKEVEDEGRLLLEAYESGKMVYTSEFWNAKVHMVSKLQDALRRAEVIRMVQVGVLPLYMAPERSEGD